MKILRPDYTIENMNWPDMSDLNLTIFDSAYLKKIIRDTKLTKKNMRIYTLL